MVSSHGAPVVTPGGGSQAAAVARYDAVPVGLTGDACQSTQYGSEPVGGGVTGGSGWCYLKRRL